MTEEDIRAKAKILGIKSHWNKKLPKLMKEIEAIEGSQVKPKAPELDIRLSKKDYNYIQSLGVKNDWMVSIAHRYGFNKLEYIDKFKAFRCYLDGKCVDWVTLNDLAADNGQGKIVEIINPPRPVDKKKRVIKFAWRQ